MRFRISGTVFAREDFFFDVEAGDIDVARVQASQEAIEGFEAQDFEVELSEIEEVTE